MSPEVRDLLAVVRGGLLAVEIGLTKAAAEVRKASDQIGEALKKASGDAPR